MKDNLKISVIVPTYKPDDSLFVCLNSLEKQTLSIESFEIILVLNGDKDPYEQEIQKYIVNSLLVIKYIFTSEKSVSNARNIGINLAKGEYITFIDSDDWVSEKYLEGLLSCTNKDHFACANILCYDPLRDIHYLDFIGKKYRILDESKEYSHLKIRPYFSVPWGKLLPNEICKHYSFSLKFDYGEDALYMFSIEPFLPKGIKAGEDVVYYRREVKNSLSRKKRTYKEIFYIHINLLLEYWKIYIFNIKNYNFIFFMFRNLAIFKHILMGR